MYLYLCTAIAAQLSMASRAHRDAEQLAGEVEGAEVGRAGGGGAGDEAVAVVADAAGRVGAGDEEAQLRRDQVRAQLYIYI